MLIAIGVNAYTIENALAQSDAVCTDLIECVVRIVKKNVRCVDRPPTNVEQQLNRRFSTNHQKKNVCMNCAGRAFCHFPQPKTTEHTIRCERWSRRITDEHTQSVVYRYNTLGVRAVLGQNQNDHIRCELVCNGTTYKTDAFFAPNVSVCREFIQRLLNFLLFGNWWTDFFSRNTTFSMNWTIFHSSNDELIVLRVKSMKIDKLNKFIYINMNLSICWTIKSTKPF